MTPDPAESAKFAAQTAVFPRSALSAPATADRACPSGRSEAAIRQREPAGGPDRAPRDSRAEHQWFKSEPYENRTPKHAGRLDMFRFQR